MFILTEKPSVAKAFAEAFNISQKVNGYYTDGSVDISNCKGHLYELAKPEDYNEALKIWKFENLPFIPEHYKYNKNDDVISQIKLVSHLLQKHKNDKIIIATDADREGEVIARIVFSQAGLKDTSNCYRFWVSEALTPEVIKKGLDNVTHWDNYIPLAKNGFARQHADWLVGFNLTPYATLLAGHKITLPVGRVQTSILAAIAQRNNEVKNFVPSPYFQGIATLVDSQKNIAKAYLINPENNKSFFLQEENYLQKAIDFSNTNKSINLITETKRKNLNPPKLLTLTELQKIAAKDFDYSASKTLELAQNLYEKHKCLSYPRTPSFVMGDDDVELFREKYDYLKSTFPLSKYCNEKLINKDNKHIFNSKKLDSHHALIPLDKLPSSATEAEKNIYQIVLTRFFMSIMNQCIYDEKTLFIQNGDYKYKAIIKVIVEEGFKKCEKELAPNGANKKESDEEKDEMIFFDEKSCKLSSVEKVKKMTTPKKEFTETSLLSFMENPYMENTEEKLVGLGTPATRGDILSKLEDYKYITKQSKKYYATDKALFLLKILFKNEYTQKITSISQTTEWEKQLENNPESFEKSIIEFIKNCVKTHPEVESYEKPGLVKCPLCNGKVFEGQKSYFCQNINKEPKCKFIIYKTSFGGNITQKDLLALVSGKSTGVKTLKSKAGKPYKAKLNLDINTMKLQMQFVNT